ncbi:MAG: outer membrane beta-barrel protein [Flavobacteriales bacterium]|nr:outer membrane beta-barrel protein [Flavobacteriales bacterium]
MRRILTLLALITFFNVSYAQRYEIGFFAGGNNIIGDFGSDYYIAPTGATFGGLFRYDMNERLSLRTNIYASKVNQDIEKAWLPYGDVKKIVPKSHGVYTVDVVAEWNFYEFNLRKRDRHTPFMYAGIGGIAYQQVVDLNADDDKKSPEYDKKGMGGTVTIPFGVGYKYAMSTRWVLAADLGFRYTFTDDLDSSETREMGNLNSNDWFTTIGVSLTYVFGRDRLNKKVFGH